MREKGLELTDNEEKNSSEKNVMQKYNWVKIQTVL